MKFEIKKAYYIYFGIVPKNDVIMATILSISQQLYRYIITNPLPTKTEHEYKRAELQVIAHKLGIIS